MAVVGRYERLATLRPSIFGEILLCVDRETRDEVVVKTVDLSMALRQESRQYGVVKENVLKEIEVMTQLCAAGGHPNVITMRNYYVSKATNMLHIVLDYCEGGDLLEACAPPADAGDADGELDAVIQLAPVQKTRVDERTALGYLKDVVSGLSFLHRHGIAHRDLSLENILLRRGRAVIADFGLCAQQAPDEALDGFRRDDVVGKHYYMAPEVVAQTAHDPRKADVWSVGISFFILLTSSPPFEMASPKDAGFRYIAKNGLKAVFKAWNVSPKVSEAAQDLLEKMVSIDPAQRPTLEEIMAHPALTELSRPAPCAAHDMDLVHPCAATATEAA